MDKLSAHSVLTDAHSQNVTQTKAFQFDIGGLAIEELLLKGMVRLQSQITDEELSDRLGLSMMSLPKAGEFTVVGNVGANSSGRAVTMRCLWLRPHEWLLVTPAGDEEVVKNALVQALAGIHALVTVITDSRLALAISGPSVAELLSKGCALDLHRSQFVVGQCASTRFAKIAAVVTRISDCRYELYVDRSHGRYLWEWLVDAAAEFEP